MSNYYSDIKFRYTADELQAKWEAARLANKKARVEGLAEEFNHWLLELCSEWETSCRGPGERAMFETTEDDDIVNLLIAILKDRGFDAVLNTNNPGRVSYIQLCFL